MANNQRFSITFDASLNVSQMKGALGDIQKSLNNLHLPQNATKGLQGTFSKLSEEIQKFEVAAGKEIGSKADFSKIEKSATKIGELFEKLKLQVSELSGKSAKELEKLFPDNIGKNINQASEALKKYQIAFKNAKTDVDNAAKSVDKFNRALTKEKGKTPISTEAFKKLEQDSKAAQADVDQLGTKLQELQQKQANLYNTLSQPNKSSVYRKLGLEIADVSQKLEEAREKATALAAQKANTTTFDKQAKEIAKLTASLTEAQGKLTQFEQIFNQLKNPQGADLSKLIQQVGQLTGLDMSKFTADAQGVGQAIQTYINQNITRLQQGFNNLGPSMDRASTGVSSLRQKIVECGREFTSMDQRMRDVDALKSRILYFFSLNNTLNLVKRTIRSAFETVKELDKAMTETAVVTDFSVADMWAQLPDYTKRANDLGVTTKAAYEAATLYYQQGLKTNEVMAMSNETLKMARIAGLDASVATDRMTNAIRGFNMEINETNAQRIDDVYSRLAAISASNVDEISTAMTKVASLANSANMEFETTSAFLAQIIETTRESAETAGTALKTVVARFAEVKKLVNEDQLRGQDEEGQIIDVNRVQAALRTAGVDLNKFFLGEVGIDDIFMELASKWDSLTTLQQRYIATQAAGSRQQSRFIALMSDYGRMQELVGEAYNANGAAAEQFAKTQESLESKLARLKNAWNEFAMGIANSDLIKAGVDILTKLLNFVNNLTDGFGTLTGSVGGFISSILKLSLLIGGLKLGKNLLGGTIGGIGALFRGAEGGFSGGFRSVIGPSLIGNALGSLGKGALSKFANWGLAKGATGLSGSIGSLVSKGAFSLFGTEAVASGAAGAAATTAGGLAAGLATIAPYAIAAAVAVKKLYDLSPAGQVKAAEKYAASISKIAKEAKKTKDSLKEVQTKYSEYGQAISKATDTQERLKAIQSRNEFLSSALESNPQLAQYLQSEVKNGEFVLTINENAFTDAIAKAEETEKNSNISDLLAQANVAAQKADYAAAKIWGLTQSPGAAGARNKELEARAAQFSTQQQSFDIQSKQLAKQAAVEMISGSGLSDNLTSILANSYANAFDADKMQKAVTKGTGWLGAFFNWGENSEKYQAIYGVGSQKGVSLRDRAKAVKAAEYTNEQQVAMNQLIKYLKEANSKKYEDILKAYSGDFSGYSSLIGEGGELKLNYNGAALNQIATALGTTSEAIKTQIQNSAQTERERQLQVRDAGYYSMAKAGSSKTDIARYLTLENFSDMELVSGLVQQFEDSNVGDEIAHVVLDQIDAGTFEGSALQDWLEKLNFDSPIAGAKALHDALQLEDDSPIKQLALSIEDDEEAMAQFSASAQLGYLMTSENADQLNESLSEFIEENGSISSANIEELAASNAELNDLLESGTFTAKGLAVALQGISTGAFSFQELNDAILAAFNNMDDLEGIVAGTIQDLNGFDPGYDENDITKFLGSAYDVITENFDKGAYGNHAMGSYMQEIFGEFTPTEGQDYGEGYKAWTQQNIQWLAANKDNMYSAWADVAASWQNGVEGVADIVNTGSEILITLNGQTTQDLVNSLKENTNLTETQIRMMIADYKNYSADFAHELALNDADNAIDAFMEANRKHIGDQALYTKQELETLAKGLGLSLEEVRKQILEKSGEAKAKKVKIIDVDVEDINSIKDALDKVTDEVGDYANSKGVINATNLKKGLGLLGLGDQFDSILNQLTEGAESFEWDFGGDIGIKEVMIEEGQTAGEALASAMEAAAQEQFGEKFFSGVVAAAAANDIEIEAIDIPLDIDTTEVQNQLQTVIDDLNTIDGINPSSNVSVPGADGATTSINNLTSALKNLQSIGTITVSVVATGDTSGTSSFGKKQPPHVYDQSGTRAGMASGGYANSGTALTGEEGPEIVWNKDQGYAYVTGKHGPEYQNLQAGDRVFTAQETRKILKNSKKNGITNSFANGTAHGYGGANKYSASTGSSSKASSKAATESKTSDEWKNELDWLYNLMEDIAEAERAQTKLAEKHERYLKDTTKTGRELYNITKQQMQNLNQQYDMQKQALAGREREMQEQIMQSGYTDYVWWNNNDRTIEINWDKIEAIQDKDTYDKVSELVSKAEDIQGKIDTAEDALLDIEDQMKELQERYIKEYVDFEKRVLDAVVNKYQEQIDNLSELNDIINDNNTDILNSIREEVDLQRQIRDNTDTENQIKDMEARLAYLRRDTTGANQSEILQLEQQLEQARQDYSDTLIDQSIDRLQQDNEAAAEQRQHQIDLLTTQLDYWQKTGELWGEVHELMKNGISPEGWIRFDSDLMTYLKNTEEFRSMSQAQQDEWIKELEQVIMEVGAYTLNKKHPLWDDSTDYMAIMESLLSQRGKQALKEPAYKEAAAARVEKRIAQGATRAQALQEQSQTEQKYLNSGSSTSNVNAWSKNIDYMAIMEKLLKEKGINALFDTTYQNAAAARVEKYVALGMGTRAQALQEQKNLEWSAIDFSDVMEQRLQSLGAKALTDPIYMRAAQERINKYVALGMGSTAQATAEQKALEEKYLKKKGYATGGLASKTGLAWLDGTTNEPEYVLNARQTEAFLRLSEVLPSMFGNANSSTITNGNVYLELTMNIKEIASDYDVDRLVERVKQDIYDASTYRNVNVISSIR